MVYSFELIQHANIRFREAVCRLSRCELLCMLRTFGFEPEIHEEMLGGLPFLTFESRALSAEELIRLRRLSSVSLMAERHGDMLSPVSVSSPFLLPEDLPEVLKYKGKTSVPFTRMMINTALSLVPGGMFRNDIVLMDPLCGKGTSLFCALQHGMDAIGMDLDRRAVHEAEEYFSRYLKLHRVKHSVKARSETLGKQSVPVTEFSFSGSKEQLSRGETQHLLLSVGDTEQIPALVRRKPVHLIVADLPYGVQHAPQSDRQPESFVSLLKRALPVWARALSPGGALALSFNTYTLPTRTLVQMIRQVGLIPCLDPPFDALSHQIEQAVLRDVVFAKKHEGGLKYDFE